MRKTHLSVAIIAACGSIFATSTIASPFVIIVNEHYKMLPGSVIPSDSILATLLNTTTTNSVSGDMLTTNLSLKAEPTEIIQVTTDLTELTNKELVLTGEWSSSPIVSFIINDMNEVVFESPEYDGDILLSLNLQDGLYEETIQNIIINNEHWTTAPDKVSEWSIDKIEQDWYPDLSTRYENELVTETRVVDKSRTIQPQEERKSTGEFRNSGELIVENKDDFVEQRTESYGLKEYWEQTDPIVIQDWKVVEVFQDWNPDASTVYETETVDQSREVKKERIIKTQEIRPATGEIRVTSGNISDTSVQFEYRTVDGELEHWVNTGEESCTEWTFDRSENWLPSASNYPRTEQVNQTRKVYESRECSGEQERVKTGEIRYATAEVEYRFEEESRTVNGTLINLNDWSTKDTNGNWSVSQDGSFAFQSINGNSTIFESKADNYKNTSIKGKMRVRSDAGDDDFIGFVVGMEDSNNFYLWSWKKSNQAINGGTSYAGHNLAKVTKGVSSVNWFMHKSYSGYEHLDRGPSTGWNHGVYYDFEIKYTPTKIEVYLENVKILEASGTFPEGKIGFFNLSQGNVEYYKVTEESL